MMVNDNDEDDDEDTDEDDDGDGTDCFTESPQLEHEKAHKKAILISVLR